MKCKYQLVIAILMAAVLSTCGTKASEQLLDFTWSDNASGGVIYYNDTAYYAYGIPHKSDMKGQIGIIDDDTKNQVHLFRDYPMEDFIIEYYRSGLMDNPILYRAENCTAEPEKITPWPDEEP